MRIRDARVEDLEAIVALRTEAFAPGGESRAWFGERCGIDGFLVAELAGRVVAAAQFVPVGQYFGGRSVPMGAVASVMVETESRGTGIAPALLRALLARMRAEGLAISTLYASTVRLYRGVGYEIGGEGTNTCVPTSAFAPIDPGAPEHLRRGDQRDIDAMRACYERVAPARNGWIDRSPLWWDRYKHLPRDGFYLSVFDRDGRVGGYSVRSQQPAGSGDMRVTLHELVTDEPLISTTLWRALGAHAMQASHVTVTNLPVDELLLVFPEQRDVVRPRVSDRTLTRILDLRSAIEHRGFPRGAAVRVELEVDDPLVEPNAGRAILEVDGGAGALEPGGSGAVRAGIGALAALYTGWSSARTLAHHGRMAGPRADLEALDTAFAGPTPYCVDTF